LNPQNEYSFLGRLVGSDNLRRHNDFIDLIFLDKDNGELDKVYISFLEEAIIPNYVPVDTIISVELWKEFREEFDKKTTHVDKKKLMFKSDYFKIRKMLEGSIYTTLPNEIVQNHKIEKIFKSNLESNIKAVLKESSAEISADVEAKFENLIKNEVDLKGSYIDIEFRKEFVGKLRILLRKLKNKPPSDDTEDEFLINYLDFFIGKNDLIASGYSILQFEITYNTTKITKSEIKLIIDGVGTISEADKVNLTAKIYSSFSYTRDFNGESKSTKNYLVKYSYKSDLQGEKPNQKE
jgi:hypothetical protein